jgi:predicted CXXCH cytochrome family protein
MKTKILPLLAVLLCLGFPSAFVWAIENKECMGCHGTPDILKMSEEEKSGMVVPSTGRQPEKRIRLGLFLEEQKFKSSVHNQLGCTDCHSDIQEVPHAQRLARVQCDNCHADAAKQYEHSSHARAAGGLCVSCHNPHEARSYKGLSITERSGICLPCHGKGGHEWLPELDLHFSSLECTVCHSPEAKRELLLYFSTSKRVPLAYEQLKRVGGKRWDPDRMFASNGGVTAELGDIKGLLDLLEKGGMKSARLAGDGLVAEPDHGFTAVVDHIKDCTECHSPKKTFYASAALRIPSSKGWKVFPVGKDVAAKLSVIPENTSYFTTIHAKNGVKCIECHGYQRVIREAGGFTVTKMKELVCGTRCHKNIMDEYKASAHYRVHEHFCLDCHQPHPNTPYAELDASQRRAICERCHRDTDKLHRWQTQQTLHCRFVECTMCHAPKARKGIVLYLRGVDHQGRERRLDRKDLAELANTGKHDFADLIAGHADKPLDERSLSNLLKSLNNPEILRRQGFQRIDLGVNLLVLRPFHDFTEKLAKAKDCSLCHSSEGEALSSLVLRIPGSNGDTKMIPVEKEALVAFIPLPGIGNFYLLGGKRASTSDIWSLWKARDLKTVVSFGYKWIDLIGFAFVLGAVGFVGVHGSLRIMTRRLRKERKRAEDLEDV